MRFIVNKNDLTMEDAIKLLEEPRAKIAIDVETVNLENRLPLGVAVAISPDLGFYFFDPNDTLLHGLVDRTPLVIFQNGKFDIPILNKYGYKFPNYDDTQLLAYSGGMLSNSLEALSQTVLSRECPSVTSQWRKPNQGNIAIDHVKMGQISIIHACNTFALHDKLKRTRLYEEIDKPSNKLVIEMEHWGILIDQYKLTQVEQLSVVKAAEIEAVLKAEFGDINLASNPQVAKALQDKGIIGTRKTKAGKDSVSEESLKPLHHPIADAVLKWRSLMKTLTTYVPAFRNTDIYGRLHTDFGYTNTGRWKSSNPNLQNITRDDKLAELGLDTEASLRKCMVAAEGHTFICPDASQIELRAMAILSQDPQMLEDLRTGDLHKATAIRMFGFTDDEAEMKRRRYKAKQGNFALVYMASEFKLAEMLECSVEEALQFMADHKEAYPVLYAWMEAMRKLAKERGYVTTLFGRIRPIPELTSGSWKIREKAEREIVNTIVQGTAVDIVKLMMLYIKAILDPTVRFILQVHDEIVLEVPDHLIDKTLACIKELEQAFPDYPCETAMGKCYGNMERIKL